MTPLDPETRARLEQLEYAFHVRVFGEELARINFLPLFERKRELDELQRFARSKGVVDEKPALGFT